MNRYEKTKTFAAAAFLSGALLSPALSHATVVEFQTNMGNFEVNLYDNDTPQTVANFLSYANNSAYVNSVFHRSVPNFVVQGGGFTYNSVPMTLDPITENAPVVNEPEFANVRGTIAMARPPSGVDTATNQWFINTGDNSGSLDSQDFAVFGEVVGNGMNVVDAIAALPTFAFASPFGELPLANYTNADFTNGVDFNSTHLVIVDAIVVTDATVDSAGAAGLSPQANTANAVTPPPTPTPTPPASGGGGGSLGIPGLLVLLFALHRRRSARLVQAV